MNILGDESRAQVKRRVVWSTPMRAARQTLRVPWILSTGALLVGAVVSLALIIAGTASAVLDIDLLTAIPLGILAGTLIGEFIVVVRRAPVLDTGRLANTAVLVAAWCAVQLAVGVVVWIGYVVQSADPDGMVIARIALSIGAGVYASVIAGLLANANMPEAGDVPHGEQRGSVDGDHLL